MSAPLAINVDRDRKRSTTRTVIVGLSLTAAVLLALGLMFEGSLVDSLNEIRDGHSAMKMLRVTKERIASLRERLMRSRLNSGDSSLPLSQKSEESEGGLPLFALGRARVLRASNFLYCAVQADSNNWELIMQNHKAWCRLCDKCTYFVSDHAAADRHFRALGAKGIHMVQLKVVGEGENEKDHMGWKQRKIMEFLDGGMFGCGETCQLPRQTRSYCCGRSALSLTEVP